MSTQNREMDKIVIRSVLSKCRSKDIETLIRKWGCFSDEDIQQLNFRATKNKLAHDIFQLCQELGFEQEVGNLDLLCIGTKTDLDPQELQNKLATVLDANCVGNVHLNAKSYGGATWLRLYVQGTAPFRTSDVVYILSYPHTPVVITCRMKVKMQEILYSALLEVFETEEIYEPQLTGHHLPSLADLALQKTGQGPFRKYRDAEDAERPLFRSRISKQTDVSEDTEKVLNPRLIDENRHEKLLRQEKLDRTFGTHTQPNLEKLEYKLDLRFRGTTFAPGMRGKPDLFRCRVKFEGISVLEGTKNLGKTGLATLPLPRHLAKVHSLAKNHFTIAEVDSVRRPVGSHNSDP